MVGDVGSAACEAEDEDEQKTCQLHFSCRTRPESEKIYAMFHRVKDK